MTGAAGAGGCSAPHTSSTRLDRSVVHRRMPFFSSAVRMVFTVPRVVTVGSRPTTSPAARLDASQASIEGVSGKPAFISAQPAEASSCFVACRK